MPTSLGVLRPVHRDHVRLTMSQVGRHINPRNHIAASFTGDSRLQNWAVIYDNAIRAMAHLCVGEMSKARRTVDYFINSKAIRRNGWIMNIVHAATSRVGGWGLERTTHTGPNAYVGMAAAHLYTATREARYLAFARERWELIKTLQNEIPGDPNIGGVRMGPRATGPSVAQHLDEDRRNPTFYEFYNGEHAADFRGFSLLMAEVDPPRRARYRAAAALLVEWDKKIWDPRRRLFAIGTTEKRYYDANIGRWVNPGVIPMHPLDTNALKISSYGLDGLEAFGKGTGEALRRSIEENYRVTVSIGGVKVSGYDFVSHEDRARLIFYEERGAHGRTKVRLGRGRGPLLGRVVHLGGAGGSTARGRSPEEGKHGQNGALPQSLPLQCGGERASHGHEDP